MVPNSEIEEDLHNQNLDFLEEDEDHTKDNLASKSKGSEPNNIDIPGLIKKFIMPISIVGLILIVCVIVGLFKYMKSQDVKNSLVPDNINVSDPNPPKDNQTLKSVIPSNNINSATDQKNNSLLPPVKVIDKQIGEIKSPSIANNAAPNVIVPPENKDLPVNNLTWQEIKKSVDQSPVPAANNLPNQITTPEATNNNQAVNGFEIKTNPTQIAQINQISNDHKEQQETKQFMDNFTKDLSENTNQVNNLRNNLTELSMELKEHLRQLDEKISQITNSINGLSGDLKNVKKYIQDEDLELNTSLLNSNSEKDLFSNNPEYVIHAVIPGRAWLKSSSGQIITVAEGDLLGDYGKVALIDATNNVVRTSSGVVFK